MIGWVEGRAGRCQQTFGTEAKLGRGGGARCEGE